MEFWAKTTPDGKPGISVYDHMLDVGWVAHCIAELSPEILNRFNLESKEIGVLAALHDIGKISPGFQRKCAAWLEENGLTKIDRNCCWDTAMEADHGKVSHAAIQSFLIESGFSRKTGKFLSAVLGAHHGRLNPPKDRGYRPQKLICETSSSIDWDAERKKNAQMIWDRLEGGISDLVFTDETPSLWWLAGLTTVADWIGSNEAFFSPDRRTENEDVAVLAQNALDVIGFKPLEVIPDLSFHELFHDAEQSDIKWKPNEMQEKAFAAVAGPGVYVIEAPMGMGKTEAALWAAYRLLETGKATGIYFALPTQATSNRIHLRMNEFLRRIASATPASRLIHGNSWLMETNCFLSPAATEPKGKINDDARTGREWFSSTKRALLSPFGVGTVDQALLGVVAAKHFFVRHFALAGKVVILDEVHSYDLYTGMLIDKLIETLEALGCTVIVLSATLTEKRLGQIVELADTDIEAAQLPYPLITGRHEGQTLEPSASPPPSSQTVKVEFISAKKAALAAIELAQKGGAVLWICNTVDAAQSQYRRFMAQIGGDFPIGLLHSRFPFHRRQKLEAEWMERFGKSGKSRCGSILVSTQVVEQSVDLDADLMITELVPTDMILQRLGRLWRHERDKRPIDLARLYIIEEEKSLAEFWNMEPKAIVEALGGKAHVYAPYVLLRTLNVWQQYKEVSIPDQIRILIEETYDVLDGEPESWTNLFYECEGNAMAHRQKALMSSNVWNIQLPDEEGVQTRLNEMPTIALVLCKTITKQEAVFIDDSKCCFGNEKLRLPTAQAIHKNLVKVPQYCFDHVGPHPALEDYLYGSQTIGIVTPSGNVEVKGLKNVIRFFYSDELGLVIEK